jgi:hypothetical protein
MRALEHLPNMQGTLFNPYHQKTKDKNKDSQHDMKQYSISTLIFMYFFKYSFSINNLIQIQIC